MTNAQTEARAIAWRAKASVLRSRGKANTAHDIGQAADYLDEAAIAIAAKDADREKAVAPANREGRMVEPIKITYRDGAYRVNRPEWDGGDVVMATDYATLKAENERLREELACEIEDRIKYHGDDMGDTQAARVAELRAERALAERAGGVKVRAIAEDAKKMCEEGHPVSAFNLAQLILSALATEPAAPEGEQEARPSHCGGCGETDPNKRCIGCLADFGPTHPAEQAVTGRKFSLGDRVTKVKGSSWTGQIVGFYSTSLTPIGYAVESETETGSVQIYPEAALKAAMEAGR